MDPADGTLPAASAAERDSALGKLEHIGAAVNAAHTRPAPRVGGSGPVQFLAALALLRELRAQIATWEPDLIDAARAQGASWAQLAPALGVASRQAAERRYLRLRPDTAATASATTGDQRVAAERDRRAGQRAVTDWARDHAADLRQLAGQIGALNDLPAAADAGLDELRRALGEQDPALLLAPLADARPHLGEAHPALAERLDELARHTGALRRESTEQRAARAGVGRRPAPTGARDAAGQPPGRGAGHR